MIHWYNNVICKITSFSGNAFVRNKKTNIVMTLQILFCNVKAPIIIDSTKMTYILSMKGKVFIGGIMKDETPYHHHPYSTIHITFLPCSQSFDNFLTLFVHFLNWMRVKLEDTTEAEEAWEAYACKLEHAFELCRWNFVWKSIAKC